MSVVPESSATVVGHLGTDGVQTEGIMESSSGSQDRYMEQNSWMRTTAIEKSNSCLTTR